MKAHVIDIDVNEYIYYGAGKADFKLILQLINVLYEEYSHISNMKYVGFSYAYAYFL